MMLASCSFVERVEESMDHGFFGIFGSTLISRVDLLTIKEIHFDTGVLYGRKIIVEGVIREVGNYGTFLIVEDSHGKILIALTQMSRSASELRGFEVGQAVRVLGTVENGKKGFPYLKANKLVLASNT
jgi:hypothetical protein